MKNGTRLKIAEPIGQYLQGIKHKHAFFSKKYTGFKENNQSSMKLQQHGSGIPMISFYLNNK